MSEYVLEMRRISKEFPGVQALDNIDLTLKKAEVLGLCGENGAGKSTLIKILSGIYPHNSFAGELFLDGVEHKFSSVKDSEEAGIATIFQEIDLIEQMSVAENIFLNSWPQKYGVIKWELIRAEAKKWLEVVGLNVSPEEKVKNLGVGQQQLVEIAKALYKKTRILILDEPTASLSETEANNLLRIIPTLTEKGVSCIYISHKLEEVCQIANRITVIRDGKHIGTAPTSELDKDSIIYMMVGRQFKNMYPEKKQSVDDEVVLSVRNLRVRDKQNINRMILQNIDFDLYKGEILGVAGLVGSGRTELAFTLFGECPGVMESGAIIMDGVELNLKNTRDAISKGIAYVSEDRKTVSLVLGQNIKKNITLPNMKKICRPFINEDLENQFAHKYQEKLSIKAASLDMLVKNLSGGNQQKVAISKWLMSDPKVLILDEPTRGIDISVKHEIYKIMRTLADEGVSILMISSEMNELLGMCSRMIIMREGHMACVLGGENLQQEAIMKYAIN